MELAYLLWRATGRTDHLDATFRAAARCVLEVWKLELDHDRSPYAFERPGGPASDTLSRQGRGAPVGPTGMTWSGFRPSDDACRYGYLVPANMMAVVALGHLATLADEVLTDADLAAEARTLRSTLAEGIEAHGRVEHPRFGTIYAYEVDGLGGHHLMDDANVPSLLSAPYLGYCRPDDPTYLATRAFALSEANPYFFRGTVAAGVGSPHTPEGYVWPIALCVQGLTARDEAEKLGLLERLLATDAGTGLMHEGFHVDDPARFTRPWFAWANSLFAEFVLDCCGVRVPGAGGDLLDP